jgi:hypothetical protein
MLDGTLIVNDGGKVGVPVYSFARFASALFTFISG